MKYTIVGGGFAGVKTALELAKDKKNEITLITDRDTFQYYPTLYSSATGKSHLESWVPLGEIFAKYDNIHVSIDHVIGIDDQKKEVIGASEARYPYSTLIIAVGTVTTYFGIPGMDQYSYGIKSYEEIRRLKERIFEDLTTEKKLDKNYVIIGAGPTGVELAGALGTYLRRLCKYHGVKNPRVSIRLIEAAPRVLPRSHPNVSKRVHKRLEKLGVEVQVGVKVEKATAESVIAGGRPIASHTVIWTSGVMNNPLFATHPHIFQLSPKGRVVVDKHMKAAKNIYVIGDNAETPYSGLAQTALYDAKFIARNFKRRQKGKKLKAYRPVLPISIIPVGRRWAAMEWKWIRVYGWLASVMRRLGDFHGYSSYLPYGQAIRPWHASTIYERDYFTPIQGASRPIRKRKRRR